MPFRFDFSGICTFSLSASVWKQLAFCQMHRIAFENRHSRSFSLVFSHLLLVGLGLLDKHVLAHVFCYSRRMSFWGHYSVYEVFEICSSCAVCRNFSNVCRIWETMEIYIEHSLWLGGKMIIVDTVIWFWLLSLEFAHFSEMLTFESNWHLSNASCAWIPIFL